MVLDTVGVTDVVGLAAPVGEAAGLVAAGLDRVAVALGDAWPAEDWPPEDWPPADWPPADAG